MDGCLLAGTEIHFFVVSDTTNGKSKAHVCEPDQYLLPIGYLLYNSDIVEIDSWLTLALNCILSVPVIR